MKVPILIKLIAIIAILAIVGVVLIISSIKNAFECNLGYSGPIHTDVSLNISNDDEAFDELQKFISPETRDMWGYKYSTLNATKDSLIFEEIELNNGEKIEGWTFNRDLAIDKSGKIYIKGYCI